MSLSEDKQTNDLIAGIVNTMFKDVTDTAEKRIRLAELVGYGRGHRAGFQEGYISAMNEMRAKVDSVREFVYPSPGEE